MTTLRKLALLAVFSCCSASFAQTPEPGTYREIYPDMSFLVIELKYANAEELASRLTAVLPAGVTVVPYPPTNSLIISGPSTIIDMLEGRAAVPRS